MLLYYTKIVLESLPSVKKLLTFHSHLRLRHVYLKYGSQIITSEPHLDNESQRYICFYNYHNSGQYTLSCLLFKTRLNSIGLSVPHRKHIKSLLRVQQVNAIYRFVTMVYYS
jgi:hypothetical protein